MKFKEGDKVFIDLASLLRDYPEVNQDEPPSVTGEVKGYFAHIGTDCVAVNVRTIQTIEFFGRVVGEQMGTFVYHIPDKYVHRIVESSVVHRQQEAGGGVLCGSASFR